MKTLNKSGLLIDVLGMVKPDLAETLRLENMLAEKIEVVAFIGDENDVPFAVGQKLEPQPGRVIVKNPVDAAALVAADGICHRLNSIWEKSMRAGELNKQLIFLGVLGQVNPALYEAMALESELAGEPVSVQLYDSGDVVEELFGTVTLDSSGEDGASAMYAAAVADDLYELFERNTISVPEISWYKRLLRRN